MTVDSGDEPTPAAGLSFATQLFHVLVLFVLGAAWGLEPSLIKTAIEAGADEILSLVVALTGVSVLSFLLVALNGALYRFWRANYLIFFIISSLLNYIGPLLIAFFVAENIDAGLLTLIVSMVPIFTVVLAIVLRIEPVDARMIAAVVLGAGAGALVLVPESALPDPGMAVWALIATAIPVSYAVGNIYLARAWPSELSPVQAVAGEAVVATVLLLPVALFIMQPGALGQFFGDGLSIPVLAMSALSVVTVLEVYLFYWIIRARGAVFASCASFATIGAGFLWGFIVFGETPTPWVWAAMGLIALALALLIPIRLPSFFRP